MESPASRTLAVVLVGLAGLALVTGVAVEFPGATPFGTGTMFAAHLALAALAMLAAILTWTGERRAEAVAVAAVAIAAVLTVVDLVNGFWYVGPAMGGGVLAAVLLLARRLAEIDEARHGQAA